MARSTAFFMNGGAGRVIASVPAFELFLKENPKDDFIIVCEGGTDFYKGHPLLSKRVFDHWHKGLFETYIKDRNCMSPEPYRVWEYYNQKCSLAQAFDIEINNKGLRDLPKPTLNLNKTEVVGAANVVEEVKKVTGFDKTLVIQPFGRTVENMGDFLVDPTSRSFQLNNIIDIINILKKEYGVIIMSEHPVVVDDNPNPKHPVAQPEIPDMRIWAGIIDIADHFLGCDSLGQHIVKALGKKATIVTGSTYPVNISYPDDDNFDIIVVVYNNNNWNIEYFSGSVIDLNNCIKWIQWMWNNITSFFITSCCFNCYSCSSTIYKNSLLAISCSSFFKCSYNTILFGNISFTKNTVNI